MELSEESPFLCLELARAGVVDGVTCRELLDELAEKLQSKLSFTPEQTHIDPLPRDAASDVQDERIRDRTRDDLAQWNRRLSTRRQPHLWIPPGNA